MNQVGMAVDWDTRANAPSWTPARCPKRQSFCRTGTAAHWIRMPRAIRRMRKLAKRGGVMGCQFWPRTRRRWHVWRHTPLAPLNLVDRPNETPAPRYYSETW